MPFTFRLSIVSASLRHSPFIIGARFLTPLPPQALAEKILDYRLDMEAGSGPYFSPEIAEAIHQLWKDPIIAKIMDEHLSDFYLMDSAG